MTDNLTKEQRSKCMSRIKSKWTKNEKKVHGYLKGNNIKHEMHPDLPGNPDVLLKDVNKVIFIHGCFWHKCPKCYKIPKTNKDYWLSKIEKNVKRDKRNKKMLEQSGWTVSTIWEHDLKSHFNRALRKVLK